MLTAVRKTKTNDERKVWHIVNGTISRCETWKVSRAMWSLQGKLICATRDEERVLVYSGKIWKGRLVSQFTECNWLDRRKCKYLDSLRVEDKSGTATRRERSRCEKNWKLSANGPWPRPGPMDKRENYPQARCEIKNLRQQADQPSNHLHSSESWNSTNTL